MQKNKSADGTTRRELLDAMGSQTTDADANAMWHLLAERGIDELDDISDEDFFALIPLALAKARGGA